MKKVRNVKRELFFTAVACMLVLFVGCATNNMPDTIVESSTVPAVSSTPLTYENKSSSTLQSIFNEEQFTTMLYQLCRFVHEPIASTEDLKSVDLFYCIVALTEDFAKYQGRTYATSEDISSYLFPVEDLKHMSNMLLGFELNFNPYQDNLYFTQQARPADHFQSDTNAFFIVFSDPYNLVKDGVSTSLSNVVSIKTNGTEVAAECELGRAKGLGAEMDSLNLTYYFEVVENGGTMYYRLKSVASIH